MTIPSAIAVSLLDYLEREERKLLCWGYTDGFFTTEELRSHAQVVLEQNAASAGSATTEDVLDELVQIHWLFAIPTVDGAYRTRAAEIVRLISKLRQIRVYPRMSPGQVLSLWRSAPPVVADFRFQAPPRTFPRRDLPLTSVAPLLGRALQPIERDVVAAFVGQRRLSGFQVRAASRILEKRGPAGTVVCAGTGSGKTIAFYLPAFLALAPLLEATPWTKCLAFYPRNELLKDQLREAISSAESVRPALQRNGRRGITFGVLYVDVKEDTTAVAHQKYGWKPMTVAGLSGRVCPFLRCPKCGAAMIWSDEDRGRGEERLRCVRTACGGEVGSRVIRLTRRSLREAPPDVLFVSTEMVNRNLSAVAYHSLFGIGVAERYRPRLLLLDEIHTYDGTAGAHVALLLRRWRFLSKARPHVVGLSATLEDAVRFFSDLTGLQTTDVEEIGPISGEMEAEGADYQLALRGDSGWGVSLLSTTIQTLVLLRRVLEPRNASALTLAGSRVFAFSDRLDGINRLLEDLRDAEGRWGDSNRVANGKTVLAGLRAPNLPEHEGRYAAGQAWDLVQEIRPHLTPQPTNDSSLLVTRTTAQDTGVDANADIIVATASLEVGYDDPTVGAVLQHKAPRSPAAFLQRKGRAGRLRRIRPDNTSVSMRPWTVVVLSDFGRDRTAYQDYEHIFSPTLKPRQLPTRNRALLRMQATYALFEYLGIAAAGARFDAKPWTTLARPARDQAEKDEQAYYIEELRLLLDDPDRQRDFGTFVQGALATTADEVDALLWEPPRSVMLEVVPTLHRRLERSWQRAFEDSLEPEERDGPPLPEFVQRTLFGKLLVPEVRIRVPVSNPDDDPYRGMLLAEALREFAPGRVSKRFDVEGGVSHWIAPGLGLTMRLDDIAGPSDRIPLGRFTYLDASGPHDVEVYRPTTLTTTNPERDIATTSNARPLWQSQIVISNDGFEVEVPVGSVLTPLVQSLSFHTHHLGNPVELRRFVVGANVAIAYVGGRRDPERTTMFADSQGRSAALGWDSEVDALSMRIRFPEDLLAFVASSENLLRSLRVRRFRELVRCESALDGVLNSFHRDTLVDSFVAAALVSLSASSTTSIHDACLAVGRDSIATVVPQVIDAETDDAETDDDTTSETMPRRVRELVDALNLPVVFEALRTHSTVLWSPVDGEWAPWVRQVLKATLGASLREAIVRTCPDIDEDDLLVEGPRVRGDDAAMVWITETMVGGSGALEAFYAAYARDPRLFARIWHSALLESDSERVASSFERTLDRIAGPTPDASVVQVIASIRAAQSHAAAQRGVQRLREALTSVGIAAEHSTLTAIFARILRPGGGPKLDAFLHRTLAAWRGIEARAGIDVDPRVFALLEASRPGLELVVPTAPSGATPETLRAWRREMLIGLLWRRPGAVRRDTLSPGNPYVSNPACDRLVVPLPDAVMPVIDVNAGDWFDALTDALNTNGVARLRTSIENEAALAHAVRWLAVHPIDTGGLQIFARLTGFARSPSNAEVTVEMPEALQ